MIDDVSCMKEQGVISRDDPSLVVGAGRLDPVVADRKNIAQNPITGQGCVRGVDGIADPVTSLDIEERMKEAIETLGQGADGGGKRLNAGKILMELTPPEWDWALADVMTQGAKKYAKRNWELGMDWSTMIGCMKRHINKFLAGERYDGPEFDLEKGETGCHHLAMVAWNALALMSYDLREIGTNDLPALQLELFDRVNVSTSDLPLEFHREKK